MKQFFLPHFEIVSSLLIPARFYMFLKMEKESTEKMVPPQEEGASSDTSAQKILDNLTDAKTFFRSVRERLYNVNEWKKYAGTFTGNFRLHDEGGNPVDRPIRLHDHFRIDGPGPGSVTGEGYDWVQVEALEEKETPHEDLISFRVRPASNPTNDKNVTAHFFKEDATSTFIVRRKDNVVYAEVHGRNEIVNTEADNFIDKARNVLAGAVAKTFFSKYQWRSLVDGLINTDEDL